MSQIRRSALVSYTAEQMYRLVNDVDSYPYFLPGCNGSRVLDANNDQVTAAVDIAKAGIRKTFITCNTLTDNRSIHMNLVEGPFHNLTGCWCFTALNDEACEIELNLNFEFNNMLVELAFGRIFKEMVCSLVQAFTQRAKEIYSSV